MFPAVAATVATNLVGSFLESLFGGGGDTHETRYVQDPKLVEQLAEFQNQNAELVDRFQELEKKIRESKIESFEDLKRFDAKSASVLVELAIKTTALPMVGRNFGFFGITSTGKSTIINKLLGENVAEVGAGETTTKIQRYQGQNYCLCDIPGRNDELSYFTMDYISFWKGLTGLLVVVQATVKEMTRVLSLLDAIHLNYDIVVNKFDNVEAEERESFKKNIKKEVERLGLKGVKKIWFVSAKNPDQFPDWLDMVNYLTMN